MKGKNTNISGAIGKLQPQALELEEAVLGALMIEKDALNLVIDILRPESFYKIAHQEIYRAIFELFSDSEPIDMLTVTQRLRKMGKLELVGGPSYIMRMTASVNSAANIEYHSRIITEQAIKRELINISSEIQRDAFEDATDVFDLLDQAEQKLFQISESNIRKNYSSMNNLMRQAIAELEARKNLKDGLTGVPTGFVDLDRITAGFQKSDLIIVAARPAMGKTAFSLSLLRNAAVDFSHPVAFFSLEMSEIQIVNRLISGEAELESEKIKRGNLAEHEWHQLYQKTSKIGESPIFIDDSPALSILELRAKCRRLKAQHDIQMIIVDYLQLMTAGSNKNMPGNREQEISTISRGLKNIAKELNVPVIALSQLSRAVETRGGDKKPQLSDLRESGSIEQDADIVLFLYRPEYYGITQDMEGNPTTNVGEVIVAKHRNGSLDTVKLKFIGKFTKFENLDNFNLNVLGGNGATDNSKPITLGSKVNNPNQFNTPPTTRLDDEPPF
ncbi:MAG: replicative DNA helicase [Microscillaceae bacterium]|jgi:replicative DNA helicase|nr:replicative DNA helicase [Microscillaceae bacterium]